MFKTAQVAPYEEARDVDDFSLRGTTAQSGTHVLPIEYRGLVLGPLVLGTYGFTKNVLVNKEQKGCWYAALPHAPNHFSREAPFAPARLRHGGVATFAGAAITTADGALSDIEGKYLHLAKCLPAAASLRQTTPTPISPPTTRASPLSRPSATRGCASEACAPGCGARHRCRRRSARSPERWPGQARGPVPFQENRA